MQQPIRDTSAAAAKTHQRRFKTEHSRNKKLLERFFGQVFTRKNRFYSDGLVYRTVEERPLSVSTRGIGFAITRTVEKLQQRHPECKENMPNLSTIYRVSLAQLQKKMTRIYNSKPFIRYWSTYDARPSSSIRQNPAEIVACHCLNLGSVAQIINSIGELNYEQKGFIPVFLKELSPLNLQITNLREYCVKMANLETEASFRMSGYQLNSIPDAIWKRKDEKDPNSIYLDNPDEIIPENYGASDLQEDLTAFRKWLDSISLLFDTGLVSEIDIESYGNPSLLVSTHVRPGNTIRINNGLIEGDQKDFWSRDRLDIDAWLLGIAGLVGEVLNPVDSDQRSNIDGARCNRGWKAIADLMMRRSDIQVHEKPHYKKPSVSKITVSNFSIEMPILKEACPLAISTRGIGFILSEAVKEMKKSANSSRKVTDELPISAVYRASLAQLEAKIYYLHGKQLGPFSSKTLEEGRFEMEPLMTPSIAKMCKEFPTNIRRIAFLINMVGHMTYKGTHFEPRFTRETTPLNLRITNLRKYCVEMADPNTDPAKRVAGYELNPIPNAKWKRQNDDDPESVILTNPDDIIPHDYNFKDDLLSDLANVQFLLQCAKISRSSDGSPGTIDFRRRGDREILVSTNVIPDHTRRLDEKNEVCGPSVLDFWSCEYLDDYSFRIGATILVGEEEEEIPGSLVMSHRSKKIAVWTYEHDFHRTCYY